jgi:hypothetical protein
MKLSFRTTNSILSLVLGLFSQSGFAKADTILTISGPIIGGAAASGESVGFTTSTPFPDVTISALLSNGGFPMGIGAAYLTTSVGSGTTIADEIAQVDINLGCSLCAQDVVLFSGLDLPAGTYWLTFGGPEAPTSGLSIGFSSPAVVQAIAGVSFLGDYVVSDGTGPFPPGSSTVTNYTANDAFPDFSVSTVPEPSGLGFTLAGLVILGTWGLTRAKSSLGGGRRG